jgi:phage shock protein PspC (stress-responsive transcriptional regulator)
MNCNEAIAELMRSIDTNVPTSEEARAHLRDCERCRALLASVSEQVPTEEAAVESSAKAAEAAVAGERKKLMIQRAIAILAAVVAFGLLMLIPLRGHTGLGTGELMLVTFMGVCLSIIVGAPLLLLFQAIANARTPRGERRFYKRLGPGRWISGVCLGIAAATGWSVTLVRLAFLLGIWFKGIGLLAYIVCSLAMPVHPADRQYLLRFRFARAWRRMRHATDDAR